jgi:tetratricopeptide (TPR) repeat protein
MPASAIGDRMRFLRRENGVEVYLDLQTNKELFVGRPQISGDAPQALLTQINAAVHEAFAIERQGPVPQPRVFKPRDPRYKRLNDELLPAMQRITTGPGREIMAAHLAEGIIQRLLNRLPQAEKALRKAHELQPMTIGPLRDLIRCIAEQGRPREALPYARQAASIDQTDAAALGNLAACLMQCGETEEAIIVVARALEIDPDDGINRHVQRALLDRGRTRP